MSPCHQPVLNQHIAACLPMSCSIAGGATQPCFPTCTSVQDTCVMHGRRCLLHLSSSEYGVLQVREQLGRSPVCALNRQGNHLQLMADRTGSCLCTLMHSWRQRLPPTCVVSSDSAAGTHRTALDQRSCPLCHGSCADSGHQPSIPGSVVTTMLMRCHRATTAYCPCRRYLAAAVAHARKAAW